MAISHTTILGKWLERLETGCPDAQEAIIEHTCERLQNMAKRMLRTSPKVRRWAETDDLLQDALVRLHRSLAQVKPTTAREFYGLAATQLRRQLIDLARKHYGPEGIGTNLPMNDSDRISLFEATPPESLDDWSEFHQQIDCLPSEQKEIFHLLWYEGLTQAEAAKVLRISHATLKRRWQSARLTLTEALQGDMPS